MADKPEETTFEIKVDADLSHWPEPVYATFLTTSRSPHDATLFFSQIRLPLIDPAAGPGSRPVKVTAHPAGRVVIPLAAIPQMLNTMQTLWAEVQKQMQLGQDPDPSTSQGGE